MQRQTHAISIWFFIGLLLAVYGILIAGTGAYELYQPPAEHTVLENLHFGIWWGILMLIAGAAGSYKFRPSKGEK